MLKSGETLLFYIKIPTQQPTAVFKMEEWKVIFCFHPQLSYSVLAVWETPPLNMEKEELLDL